MAFAPLLRRAANPAVPCRQRKPSRILHMKSSIHRLFPPVLCLCLATVPPLAAQVPTYKATEITKLTPVAINAKGQIAGNIDTASGHVHAALYSGGVVTDLGVLPG